MARKKKVNTNRLLAVAGGAAASFLINPTLHSFMAKYAKKADGSIDSGMAGKVVPLIKIGLGYLGMTKGKGWMADAALGLIAHGGVEAGQVFLPDVFKPINGIGAYYGPEGGLYAEIAGDYDYLKAGGDSLEEDHVEDIHAVYGNDTVLESADVL